MGIRVAVRHGTRYVYDRPIHLGPQWVRLRPAPHCLTPITDYALTVRPEDHTLHWQQDPVGNYLARLFFPDAVAGLELRVDLCADLVPLNPFDFFLEPYAEQFPFAYEARLLAQLLPYLGTAAAGPGLLAYAEEVDTSRRNIVEFLVDFNARVHRDLVYELRDAPGLQSPEETLRLGKGSCRDFAWMEVQVLRRLGLATRFVSGYSIQLEPHVPRDTVALHAWAEVYLPGAGWIGLDGTSGLLAGEGHLPLACAADPEDAAPITGTTEAGPVRFTTEMIVSRV